MTASRSDNFRDGLANVRRIVRLVAPIEPPSMDALDGHRWARRRWNTAYRKAFVPAVGAQRARVRAGAAKRLVIVTRLWAKGRRAYDHGNLVGGCRPLIDALVALGWLADDTPGLLEAVYNQRRSGAYDRRTAIEGGGVVVEVFGRFMDGKELRG